MFHSSQESSGVLQSQPFLLSSRPSLSLPRSFPAAPRPLALTVGLPSHYNDRCGCRLPAVSTLKVRLHFFSLCLSVSLPPPPSVFLCILAFLQLLTFFSSLHSSRLSLSFSTDWTLAAAALSCGRSLFFLSGSLYYRSSCAFSVWQKGWSCLRGKGRTHAFGICLKKRKKKPSTTLPVLQNVSCPS